MWIYIFGLLIFGFAIGKMEAFDTQHGWMIIGFGLIILGMATMILNYLDGSKKDN